MLYIVERCGLNLTKTVVYSCSCQVVMRVCLQANVTYLIDGVIHSRFGTSTTVLNSPNNVYIIMNYLLYITSAEQLMFVFLFVSLSVSQWRSDTSCVRCVRTPVSKMHNILVCDFSALCMYEDLRVKPTGMFVK